MANDEISKKQAQNKIHQEKVAKWREQKQKETAKTLHDLVHDIDEHPDDYRTYYDLGTFLVELKNYTQAEELMMKALGLFADKSVKSKNVLTYGLGNVYYAAGDYDKAIRQFQKVSDKKLKLDSYIMLAQSYMGQNNYKKAIVFALTAQGYRCQDPEINQLLGDNLLALGNFEQAGQFYDVTLKAQPKNVKALFNRGLVAMVNGEHYSDYFSKVQELDPKFFKNSQNKLEDVEKFIRVKRENDKKK